MIPSRYHASATSDRASVAVSSSGSLPRFAADRPELSLCCSASGSVGAVFTASVEILQRTLEIKLIGGELYQFNVHPATRIKLDDFTEVRDSLRRLPSRISTMARDESALVLFGSRRTASEGLGLLPEIATDPPKSIQG